MAKIGTERELAYWLMGYFEIEDTRHNLTADQTLKILRAVHGMKDEQKGELAKFVTAALMNGDAMATQKIMKKLEETFIHKIDPTIEGNQDQLRETHRPDKPPSPGGGVVAMC